MELDYAKVKRMVKEVAASVSSNFPSYVTPDETEQHLWLFLYERKSSIGKAVGEDSEWEPKIASTLRKAAFDHCAKEKASAEGYSTEDLFRYSVPKIRTLLPDAFDYEDWQPFGNFSDGQPTSKTQANMTGDRVAELIDIKIALEKLPEDRYNLLVWQFKYQYSMAQLGEEFDITPGAASDRSQRALKALQRELGRKDYVEVASPGRRTVRTNAAARAALSNQYEG